MSTSSFTLEFCTNYWRGRFQAMASPCEILCDTPDEELARQITQIAYSEALRIEQKFSRYRNDNIVYRINHSEGAAIEVDLETCALLDYAEQCFQLSDGMFDITSGVLRQIWRFDGKNTVPSQEQVQSLLCHIGWNKLQWQPPYISVPKDMEVDFGGIGKEYAVDKSAQLIRAHSQISVLINYGGDLLSTGVRSNKQGWVVGIEDPEQVGESKSGKIAKKEFELIQGAIATSGDAKRYIIHNGIRYSHILDPRSGWPIQGAPRSISVLGSTCTEAGILSTIAMLKGRSAEKFLKKQKVKFWCLR